MLSQLSIQNIAVIEKASMSFEHGFTVLTGETGAGKSIIIDAINAILGERVSKELVRTGTSAAVVSALFTDVDEKILSLAQEMGFPMEEDGALLIRREIRSEGKSLCKINGAPATVSMLKTIGVLLVSMHGQHESYELLSETMHIDYIDSYAELHKLRQQYVESYKQLREIREKLESLSTDEEQKSRRLDLLNYQIQEIEEADIRQGEQETLTKERDAIRNSEKVAAGVALLRELITGDESESGILSELTQATVSTGEIAEYLPEMGAVSEKINDAVYALEDAEALLREINTEFDPETLDEIETRLEMLYKLSLKYGETEEEILTFLEKCRTEAEEIHFSDSLQEKLSAQYEQAKTQAIDLAKRLSKKRKEAADSFTKLVKTQLASLNMPGIEFVVNIQRVPLYSLGCDKLQFLISVNRGEPPKPMSKIASGGELSRIMLAIKTVLSGRDGVHTLVFDEIDTGISGDAAAKVGDKLKQVSENRQVICITHLAQIASLANHQMRIVKHQEKERTFTSVEPLDEEGRIQELARIIGGSGHSALKLDMAREMLRKNSGK